MKTNAIANHAANEIALGEIANPVTLYKWIPELARAYRPVFLVAFGRKALGAIQDLNPLQLLRNNYQYLNPSISRPTALSFRSVQGWLGPSQDRLAYLEYLGWHWKRYATR